MRVVETTPVGTGAVRPTTVVVDLDGVVWLAGEPIAGSAGAVARLRSAGIRTVFATNNAEPTLGELVQRLARVGIEASPEDLVTSAAAAATMLEPGSAAVLLADGGVVEALEERGVRIVDRGPADAVVVGWTHRLDFDRLAVAATTVRQGARLIGTNEDPTHPTPAGLMPGTGALLAAVAAASETVPEVAGKPHAPTERLLRVRIGTSELDAGTVLVVGDRPATDGRLAERLGAPFALVRSGVTAAGAVPESIEVAMDEADLSAIADRLLGACS